MKRNSTLTSVLAVIALGILGVFFIAKNTPHTPMVTIHNQVITLEIAADAASRTIGLAKYDQLPSNKGMLFMYTDFQPRSFWMKDMKFPIDIIWLEDNRVVGIELNVPVEDNNSLTKYHSPLPVNRVLELNANMTKTLPINVGDTLDFNL